MAGTWISALVSLRDILNDVHDSGGNALRTVGGAGSSDVRIKDSAVDRYADVVVRAGDLKNALVVDTELTVESATLNIDNVYIVHKLGTPDTFVTNEQILDIAEYFEPTVAQDFENMGPWQEKTVFIEAAETGSPGSLEVWIELSHNGIDWYPLGPRESYDVTSNDLIAFTVHSEKMRLGAQSSGTSTGVDEWHITATISGKS